MNEHHAIAKQKEAKEDRAVRGFLLHVFHRQRRGKTVIYAVGKLESGETFGLVDDREPPGFYVRASDRDKARESAQTAGASVEDCSWTTMDGEPVAQVTCSQASALRKLGDRLREAGVRTYEADVTHSRRYLMNRGLRRTVSIRGSWRPGTGVDHVCINPQLAPADWEPDPAVLALDIETNPDAAQVFAVSLVGAGTEAKHDTEEIHMVGQPQPDDPPNLTCHPDEPELLKALAARIREIDPDVLTGWNVVDFDLTVLQRRFKARGLDFNLGRTIESSWYREGDVWGGSRMVVYGRQVLDALHLVRATLQRYDDFRLDTVARAILGRGKTMHASEDEAMPETILRAYREDRRTFCEYCLEDSRLVRDILESEGLIRLTVRRSLLTGLPLERAWGSVSAFEFLYITELHKRGMVAPTCGVDQPSGAGAPGGLVIATKGGLYRHVFVFDFKSLYPSIIRTFNIDPLAHVRARESDEGSAVITAPNGATFGREPGILPTMLESFFASRDQAKAEGNALASFAYKIIMNSFYGVLGTNSCRFAAPQLAGAITEFGHHFLRWTRDLLEREGYHVLYGDTDSLFVESGLSDDTDADTARARGEELCASVNEKLTAYVEGRSGVESHLEIEFEKVYRRFLLPSMRGTTDRARAKGYAGLRIDPGGETLEIIGMEAVRRDWTELAHALQRELLNMLFHDVPPEDIERYVTDGVRALRTGEKDADLVYRKSLRKPVSKYTRTTPPHVKAAKLLPNPSGVINYVMTTDGPQPLGHVIAPLDYGHYIQKQIDPIVRTIAQVCPIDVNAAVKGERSLF